MKLAVPELSLVALVGVSGSGKSTFASRHFAATQVLSSDAFRAMVSDDENDQSATADAFDALYYVAGKRLTAGRLTVVDATHLQREDRAKLIALAKAHDVLPVAIVLDLPENVCAGRNSAHRGLPAQVLARQRDALRRSLRHLQKEGFRKVHVLSTVDDVDSAEIVFEKAYNDRRELTGPFDIIGDVHGCRSELETLLASLGYLLDRDADGRAVGARHPLGRTAVFVGDLVDRGPDTPGVLRLVMGMVAAGTALCVSGNHENKLIRALDGRQVTVSHGLAESLAQLAGEPEEFRAAARDFMYGLVSHYRLDGGRLVVAHAGLKEEYHGRASGRVRSFCLYGETTGETDEYGLPVRHPWANEYRGAASVVYGHTPVSETAWVNNTICLDTGCVFGGTLTALRWPERELVSVPAERVHYEPVRPLAPPESLAQHRKADLLRIEDVLGSRTVETGILGRVKVREENAAGALEVMSRFAIDPHWLVYLPPTMAPCATASAEGFLEHPAEAFAAYRADGVSEVVCEEKHMGSRAVVVLCRDNEVARRRFGVADDTTGAVYTRTGRSFFDDPARTERLLDRVRRAVDRAGLWAELATDWLVLDAELLPWSVKAGELLRRQYAPVGAAARAVLPAAVSVLERAADRGVDVAELVARQRNRAVHAEEFTAAYGRYCWPVDDLDGVRLAPFQLLAGEGASYAARDHGWQLALLDRLVAADQDLIRATTRVVVDVRDEASVAAGTAWWTDLTDAGGEGMVVKPFAGFARGRHGVVQPGVKCRGREYLRIIYGPDYTEPAHLSRLRQRNLGRKRSLALREYALGLESLARFAAGEPLWRIHEAVFAVLALESEPVDPRL
ncbi:polynucleotide kinase-phosphatase [Solihabitans fulvus]|uniref:Polynucleotide kinase-phosphatase n=1 Tax=Solihabitans fulvus TaxID=1892852 RepID=A0A5B2XLF7_9PSEU|nr:polynucleotide kinase-phosphatase [Solihabitans fulvus]KAA2264213.1 polynucleotide kinase-phosphatase [Solihabitans fulvus]